MTRTKIAAGLAAAGAALVLVGGPAFAGEITGNGKSLKLDDGSLHGTSICAFSGQNDEFHEGVPGAPRTQSFGTEVRTFAHAGLVAETAHAGIGGKSGTHGVGVPGGACNGSLSK